MEEKTVNQCRGNLNNDRCCVEGCLKTANEYPNLHFHTFPKANKLSVDMKNYFNRVEKVDRLKAWKIALKLNNLTPKMKVCSLHFKKDDYILPDAASKIRFLKKNAVPSCNLPIKTAKKINVQANEARFKRMIMRNQKASGVDDKQKIKNSKSETKVDDSSIIDMHSEISNTCNSVSTCDFTLNSFDSALSFQDTPDTYDSAPKFQDASIQVNSDFIRPSFFQNYMKNNSELSTFTGLESFEILNTIVDAVKELYGDMFEKNGLKMLTKERVVMTYVKLKMNLSYSALAILFDCYSAKHCQRVFYTMIKVLSKCLKVLIPWPSKKQISRNLPTCFKGFEDVRVVLDCTEVYIQKPKNLCCQIVTYSHYKSAQTGKIMTGVSPSGTITYVSKLYGGRASDSTMFAQSDLINLLEPGDALMVDKGFLIDELCHTRRWKCIRPPFLHEKKQFSKEESILTAKIAAARVHVERSNQRIKTFKIVGSTMPAVLVPLLQDIFIVICATVNISSPILSDDKFMKD